MHASSFLNPLNSISTRDTAIAVPYNQKSIERDEGNKRKSLVSMCVFVCANGRNHCLVKGKSPVMVKHQGTVGFVDKIWRDISRQRENCPRHVAAEPSSRIPRRDNAEVARRGGRFYLATVRRLRLPRWMFDPIPRSPSSRRIASFSPFFPNDWARTTLAPDTSDFEDGCHK